MNLGGNMDQIAKAEARIGELERKVEVLTLSLDRLTRAADQASRKLGLPPILDEQLLHIDARGQWSRSGNAA
jgi:hypothetical protein